MIGYKVVNTCIFTIGQEEVAEMALEKRFYFLINTRHEPDAPFAKRNKTEIKGVLQFLARMHKIGPVFKELLEVAGDNTRNGGFEMNTNKGRTAASK